MKICYMPNAFGVRFSRVEFGILCTAPSQNGREVGRLLEIDFGPWLVLALGPFWPLACFRPWLVLPLGWFWFLVRFGPWRALALGPFWPLACFGLLACFGPWPVLAPSTFWPVALGSFWPLVCFGPWLVWALGLFWPYACSALVRIVTGRSRNISFAYARSTVSKSPVRHPSHKHSKCDVPNVANQRLDKGGRVG